MALKERQEVAHCVHMAQNMSAVGLHEHNNELLNLYGHALRFDVQFMMM
jgi:hypothetical protein